MGLIEDFIGRYKKEYDFYDQAARLVSQLLERNLQSAGIRAMVTFRAKSPSRLEAKVCQRSIEKDYRSLDDIYRDIVDLACVRVALYFPGERDQVDRMVRQLFFIDADPKEFPAQSKPTYEKRFSGYWATHYHVRLRDSSLNDAQKRYADALIEIQVASVLMHAWAEVEHDLVYKPMQGRLSDEEYAILDELNGLVIAGEIALERLQKAGEVRVAFRDRQFANHFDLAAYLLERAAPLLKGPASEAVLGRIDLLYDLLKRLNLVTPDGLEPYLAALTGDTERRPLAQQIIDQLLAEDAGRYKIYDALKAATDRETSFLSQDERLIAPDSQNAIGHFLSKWIAFERLIREIAARKSEGRRVGFPTTIVLQQLQLFDAETLWEIDRIRRLRNNLVHGIEIPDATEINEAGRRLEAILKRVEKNLPVSSNTSRNRTRRKRRAG
jgi:ppGpp synthetase/RelA/SpoT-type nucleotidyltranferase/uncharacterized protein YutE (UPF0331/DUF86 family)